LSDYKSPNFVQFPKSSQWLISLLFPYLYRMSVQSNNHLRRPIFPVKTLLLWLWLFPYTAAVAQTTATLNITVQDSVGAPIPFAAVQEQLTKRGGSTDSLGRLRLVLPAQTKLQMVVSHSEYQMQRFSVSLKPGETREMTILLRLKTTLLQGVEITESKQERTQAGSLNISPKTLKQVPTPFLDFNQALLSGGALGIMGNNELSSSYAVRGGNFDENLVYVENIQVYRPFLVRAGEQEGLSFIYPEMVSNVSFSSGGWQPQYGDKLSSVLNVSYKRPTESSGSVILGLLGGSTHLEGASRSKKFRYVIGARHKTSRYLLNTLETDGEYLPRFTDFQSWLTYDLSGKNKRRGTTTLGLLTSYARNRYELLPASRVTTFGTFNQVFRLNVLFVGSEELRYDTFQSGLKLSHNFSDKLRSDLIVSGVSSREREFVNVEGGYRLCDVNTNTNSSNFNQCELIRGFGSQFRYARNLLEVGLWAVESRNEWYVAEGHEQAFGLRYDRERIADELYEYTFFDSADFVQANDLSISGNNLESYRLSGHWQHTFRPNGQHELTVGGRFHYWSLNEQWLLSPRLQYAYSPVWDTDVVFRAAVGVYQQPPFYRELRDFSGNLNLDLKAQSATHFIVGADFNLRMWGRPFKLITEAYHKQLRDVIPYDLDNVRIRYYATNDASARVTGADLRLSGEFIPGTQSWFNLSLLSAKENVGFDERGYIRRPSDQWVTVSVFFEDHLPNDPSIRVTLRTLYGSGLPYGPPNNPDFRTSLRSASRYLRSDVGFSKVFKMRETSSLESVWVGLEVLNLFGVDNNISFTWVPDFRGFQYAVPNSLSQRFFNLRTVVRW